MSELGRTDEARSALADFLRVAPDATVASTRAQVPLKGPGDLDRLMMQVYAYDSNGARIFGKASGILRDDPRMTLGRRNDHEK